MKTCPRCEHTKPHTNFNRSALHRDGFQTWCRECFRDYNREWGARNKRVRIPLPRHVFLDDLVSPLRGSGCDD
ncbi:hypothetical protein GCM10010388_35400 [Streptomyces mauvecolor]